MMMSLRTTIAAIDLNNLKSNFKSVDDDVDRWREAETLKLMDTVVWAVLCAAVAVVFMMTIGLIIKLSWEDDDEHGRDVSESTKLVASNAEADPYRWYGSIDKEDLETGRGSCSCSYSSSSSSSSLWKDLYDGKLCAICYEHPRNCFFVPCGHYVSCRACAKRILEGEMKSCPICRASIDKVRKLS